MRRREFLERAAASLAVPAIGSLAAVARQTAAPRGRTPYLRAGICCYSYRQALGAGQLTYEQIVARAVAWQLDTVDLTVYWLPQPDRGYHRRLRAYAYRNGIHWSGIAARTAFTGATPAERARQLVEAQRWVDFADAMGASHLRIFGGALPAGWSETQAMPYVTEAMARLAAYAGARGITLGIENDYGVTQTADQVLHYIRAVASPWLGANADSFNSPRDSVGQFARLLPYATHIHLKTEVHDAAGAVRPADWPRIFTVVAAAGYRGSVSLEYEGQRAAADVPRYARRLRALVVETNRKYAAAAS